VLINISKLQQSHTNNYLNGALETTAVALRKCRAKTASLMIAPIGAHHSMTPKSLIP